MRSLTLSAATFAWALLATPPAWAQEEAEEAEATEELEDLGGLTEPAETDDGTDADETDDGTDADETDDGPDADEADEVTEDYEPEDVTEEVTGDGEIEEVVDDVTGDETDDEAPGGVRLTVRVVETAGEANDEPCAGCTHVPIGFDVLPLGGSSTLGRGDDVRHLSFNLIGGYSGALSGFELAGVANIERAYVHGAQLAGVANVVGGAVDGAQLAGVVNVAGASVRGAQLAGVVNTAGGGVAGAQLAGSLNIAGSDVDGYQVAGAANVTAGGVDGAQVAGALNVAGDVRGAQVAGALNVADGVAGVQIAPFNLATGRVRGAQIGVVNMAEDADFSLGLVNLLWDGRWTLDAWSGDAGLANLALRNGSRYTHSFLTVGHLAFGSRSVWSAGFGTGFHIPAGGSLAIDVDLIARALHAGGIRRGSHDNFLGTLRATLDWQPVSWFSVFMGPAANCLVSEDLGPTGLGSLEAWQLHTAGGSRGGSRRHGGSYDPDVWLWAGFELGVRLVLN